MKRRTTIASVGATLLVASVAIASATHPRASGAVPDTWSNTPGLATEADECRDDECLCFELASQKTGAATEKVCVTDAELGMLVRRMGAVCTDRESRQSLAAAITQVKEERRLHGGRQEKSK